MRPPVSDGLGAQPVFSYHARAARTETTTSRRSSKILWVDNSKSLRPQLKPQSSKRILLGCIAILIIFALLSNLFLSRSAIVVTIAESAGRQALARSPEIYQKGVAEVLSESMANSNKLTADTYKISQKVKQKFPELEEVSVALPLVGRQPVVYVLPYRPALLFKTLDNQIFLLDKNGKAVTNALDGRKLEKLGLELVRDQSGLPIRLGGTALPSSQVSFITEVVAQLKARRIKITELVLPKEASQLNLRVEGASYTVKFNLHGNAREEAGTFLAVKKYLERKKIKPAYVDVRVSNKAYYR